MENDPEVARQGAEARRGDQAIREVLGITESAWEDYLKTDSATREIVSELAALEKK